MSAPARHRRSAPAAKPRSAAARPRSAEVEPRPPEAQASPAATETRDGDPDGGAGDLHQLLTSAVEETARLLDADGAMVYLVDPATGNLRFAHDAGIDKPRTRAWIRSLELAPGTGMFGRAVADRTVVITSDYKADPTFRHAAKTDRIVDDLGIKSMVVAPLKAGDEVFGALGTFSRHSEAFDAADVALVRSLAEHAASAMANQRLIEELDRSRQELDRSRAETARRADAEQALREIAARITALRDPAEILQAVIELASRLVRGDGAILDLLDPTTGNLHWAYDDGLKRSFSADERANLWISVGQGATGVAVAEDRVVVASDDLDTLFPPGPENTMFYERTGFRSMIAAPITGESGPLGVIEVYAVRPDAFDESDVRLIRALASQSAIAITNARLFTELKQSQADVAWRADAERSLRQITARITALRDADEILQDVVDAAQRLLEADGAHLTRMGPTGTYLIPAVVAGGADPATREWLIGMRFPLGGGINGLAAQDGVTVWTSDYLTDDRIPHEGNDDEVAGRMGLVGMAAAPLRAPGGDVIGTLAISTKQSRTFDSDALELLQGLADQAAIALTNSNLLDRLTEEEERYRYLVQNAPDLIWSIDEEARLTFLSEAVERLTGFHAEELLGEHFGALVHESSRDVAEIDWTLAMEQQSQEVRGRLSLRHRDGSAVPAEFIALATLDENGRFAGANGSVRDMRERDRLERELSQSEERYRFLIQNSPDIVFATDAEGRFTFLSDAIERMIGIRAEDALGEHFSVLVDPATMPIAADRWAELVAHPGHEVQADLALIGNDGQRVPVDVRAIGVAEDGSFNGIQGATRDVSDKVRLEGELRRQAGELAAGEERAHLARELHDSVTQALFSMTLVSRSIEMLLDRDTDAAREQLGQLRELQREALAEMRALIFELRPGNLEQDGLVRALKTHAAALQGRLGLPIVVESDLSGRLPLPAEEVLYRIAQEALHNVVKHASAQQVRVDVRREGAGVRLRVEDDGKGFDPGAVPDGHLGLAGMRARADRLGAVFSCASRIGEGTTVEVAIGADALAELATTVDAARAERIDEATSIRDG